MTNPTMLDASFLHLADAGPADLARAHSRLALLAKPSAGC
jgi:hypothetical protein